MAGYTPLWSSLLDSSTWAEPPDIRCVWLTLLLMKNRHGYVAASVLGLQRRAGVSMETTLRALELFLAPDPFSRTKDNEGRRLKEVDGGWMVLNSEKYRSGKTDEEKASIAAEKEAARLAKDAERKRHERELKRQSKNVQERPKSSEVVLKTSISQSDETRTLSSGVANENTGLQNASMDKHEKLPHSHSHSHSPNQQKGVGFGPKLSPEERRQLDCFTASFSDWPAPSPGFNPEKRQKAQEAFMARNFTVSEYIRFQTALEARVQAFRDDTTSDDPRRLLGTFTNFVTNWVDKPEVTKSAAPIQEIY